MASYLWFWCSHWCINMFVIFVDVNLISSVYKVYGCSYFTFRICIFCNVATLGSYTYHWRSVGYLLALAVTAVMLWPGAFAVLEIGALLFVAPEVCVWLSVWVCVHAHVDRVLAWRPVWNNPLKKSNETIWNNWVLHGLIVWSEFFSTQVHFSLSSYTAIPLKTDLLYPPEM